LEPCQERAKLRRFLLKLLDRFERAHRASIHRLQNALQPLETFARDCWRGQNFQHAVRYIEDAVGHLTHVTADGALGLVTRETQLPYIIKVIAAAKDRSAPGAEGWYLSHQGPPYKSSIPSNASQRRRLCPLDR